MSQGPRPQPFSPRYRDRRILVVPCGISMAENVRYSLYHEPSSRACKDYRFIALYTQKVIRYIGEIDVIAKVSASASAIQCAPEVGCVTEDHRVRIKAAIAGSPQFDLKSQPHRFYLVERFLPTSFRKSSAGPIRRVRYLELSELAPEFGQPGCDCSAALAALLNGRSFA